MERIARLCMEHAVYERAPLASCPSVIALGEAVASAQPGLHVWVAEERQGIVGFASGSLGFSTWHARPQFNLDCLYLQHSARGHGLGAGLMAAVHGFAACMDCCHVEWVTPTWNAKAIAFYRHLGAQDQPRMRFRSARTDF